MGETSQNMGYSNKIRVTGTNHADQPGGKFFNFELRKTDLPWEPCGELPDGTPFGEVRLKLWNDRTEREHDVVAWDAPNGGERQGDDVACHLRQTLPHYHRGCCAVSLVGVSPLCCVCVMRCATAKNEGKGI